MNKENSPVSVSVAILIGCLMISISVLISGGVIKFKGQSSRSNTQTNTTSTSTPEEKLASLAESVGLDGDKLSSCYKRDKVKQEEEVNKDIRDADAVGPSGTPTFYIGKSNSTGTIDGVQIEGAYPYAKFQTVIDAVLAGRTITKDEGSETEVKISKVSVDDDPILGKKDAPITIIEFSDYECPFCKRHFTQTYPSLKKEYIDTGKAKLVYRDLIAVPSHNPWATQASVAANCAREQGGDEAYFKFHDAYYQKTTSNGQGI